MNEEAKNQQEAGSEVNEREAQKPDASEKLLSLLEGINTRLDTLEGRKKQEQAEKDEFEEFSDPAYQVPPEQGAKKEKEPDYENMTARELKEHIVSEVHQEMVAPLLQKLEVQRVRAEISECRGRHADFDQHKQAIYSIATKNPLLTVEQAYVLAVQGKAKPQAAQGKEEKGEERQAAPPKPPVGEKPSGMSRAGTKPSGPMSITSAAEAAFKDVYGE